METSTRLHPLLSTAAVSVIVLSVAGVGALTGVLPQSRGTTPGAAEQKPLQPAPAAAPASAPVAAPAAAPAPDAKPVKKAVVRTSASVAQKRTEAVAAQLPTYDEQEYDRNEQYEREARQAEMRADSRPAPVRVAQAVCLSCGTVESVREVATQGQGTGLGAVAGGITGAVIGKQFGHGSGKTAMTILGAAGGAFAGHKIEEKVRSSSRWDVTVRLDDGSYRTVTLEQQPGWRSGDRVRLVNGALEPERA